MPSVFHTRTRMGWENPVAHKNLHKEENMNYQIILNGKIYEVSLDLQKEDLSVKEIGVAPKLEVPFVVLGRNNDVPNNPNYNLRELVKYYCSKNQPIFPMSETIGPMAEEFKKLGWQPDEEVYLQRRKKAEDIARILFISDIYHTKINGHFIHTITPEYLILQKDGLIPVFFGNEEGDIIELQENHIRGSFLDGPIEYERRPKENGKTLIAY